MSKISKSKEEEIINAWRETKYPSLYGFEQRFSVGRQTIKKIILKAGLKYNNSHYATKEREQLDRVRTLQDTISPILTTKHHYHGNAIVSADFHCPCVDWDMVVALREKAKEHKIKQLFIVGDFFNMDVLGYYARKLGGSNKTVKMEDEMKIGVQVLEYFAEWFDRIVYSKGNHEKRWDTSVLDAFTFQVITDFLKQPKLRFLNDFHFYLDDVRIMHPRSYSQIKLSVAQRMCDKYRCDCMVAHGHFASTGYSRGGYRAVDLGAMCEWKRIQYMNLAETTHPLWNKSFIVYKDKQIYSYSKGYGLK